MKKRTYKRLERRLLRETKKAQEERTRRIGAEAKTAEAEEKASYFKERIRKIGKNMETVEPGNGKLVTMLKWEIKPELYGTYMEIERELAEVEESVFRERLAMEIAQGLIENEILQFISKGQDVCDPIYPVTTIGAKLYVVPWETMPHRRTLELMQYVENTPELDG